MNSEIRVGLVMQLRFVEILRGQSLVQLICALAVAMTSILHVDAGFAAMPPDCIMSCLPQDEDEGADDQVASERCHFCSVTAIASFVPSVATEAACPAVPSGRARSLIIFKLPATAPPPKS